MKTYTLEQLNAFAEFNQMKVNIKFFTDLIHIHGLDIFDVIELLLEAYDLI